MSKDTQFRTIDVPGTPPSRIIIGDCREVLPQLPEGAADCIFADPPFNLGEAYSVWRDTMPGREYREFTRQWLAATVPLLSARGSLWVNCPDEIAARVVTCLEDEHGLMLADWCIWHYRFGQWTNRRFVRSHVHALHFVRDANYIWNPGSVLVDSDRASKYKDARTQQTNTPGKRVPLDVWCGENDGPYWGRVQGNSAERRTQTKGALKDHPNQLPEVYLERVILSTTNEGSLVLTPFVGSGTELTVARALGRVGLGVEIGEAEAVSAAARIESGAVRINKSA